MIIDMHAHTFPDKIALTAIAKMQQACHAMAFTDGTVYGLQESARDAGIDYTVVLPVATNPLKVPAINDISIASTEKEGLIYFGCIHPEMENATEELQRIAQDGLKGIKIHPVYQGVDLDDIRYLRILDKAGELGLIVVTHAGDDIGFPGVVRCSPTMAENALRQIGPTTVVLAHMGGWRNWDDVPPLADFANVYVDTAFSLGSIVPLPDGYYTTDQLPMLGEEGFCRLVDIFGSERVLFGTDSPWSDQKQSLAVILRLPLPSWDKENILCNNAGRLLHLPL